MVSRAPRSLLLTSPLPRTNQKFWLASELRIAIVHAEYHKDIINQLVAGAKKTLLAAGVAEENLTIQSVPGSYELPLRVSW